MSDTQQTSLLIQLATKFQPEIVFQLNRDVVATRILEARLGYNAAGPNWAVRQTALSAHTAETFAEGSTVTNFGSDSQAQATLGWGLYRSAIDVSDEAMSRALASGNPTGNSRLWLNNLLNASETLGKKMNVDIYNGSGSNSIIGLETALDNSNSYAGITRSSNTYFQSYVTGLSKTALTQSEVRGDLASIKIACGSRPNVALCSPKVFQKVLAVFDLQRFYQQQTAGGVPGVSLGEAGLPSVAIEGCQFVEDVDGYYDAGSNVGTIYYLNTAHVYFEYIPYAIDPVTASDSMNTDMTPFPFNVVGLAKNGSASKAMIRTQVQLVVDRPNTCGIRRLVDCS